MRCTIAYEEPIKKVVGHRVLAINRGEEEKFLTVKIVAPVDRIIQLSRENRLLLRIMQCTTPVLYSSD